MHSEYVEQRHGGYYVAGTRISLDSVVYSFNEGQSPEAIREDFPSLKRAQIYGAIAFYLDRQAEIERSGIPRSEANPDLWERIRRNGHNVSTASFHYSRFQPRLEMNWRRPPTFFQSTIQRFNTLSQTAARSREPSAGTGSEIHA